MLEPLARFEVYLTSVEGLSAATARQYELDCRKLAYWLSAERPKVQDWPDVQEKDLMAYITTQNPAPARGRRLLSSWRKWWIYLSRIEGKTMSDGPAFIKRPKLPQRLPLYLNPKEISRLLVAAKQQPRHVNAVRDWAFIAFLYGTGLRISEGLSLTFRAIEYDDDSLPVRIRIVGKGNKERLVHLSLTAQQALREWLKLRRTLGDPASEVVFSNLSGKRRGQAFSVRTLELAALRAGERAGLPLEKCTPHKMRHSHGTALSTAGRHIEEIQEVLGHASIDTTRKYAHVITARLEAAAASLPDVM